MYTFTCPCGQPLTAEQPGSGTCPKCGTEYRMDWPAKDEPRARPYVPTISDKEGLK